MHKRKARQKSIKKPAILVLHPDGNYYAFNDIKDFVKLLSESYHKAFCKNNRKEK